MLGQRELITVHGAYNDPGEPQVTSLFGSGSPGL